MKIVHVIGGLGNQMFQYAFFIALKKHYEKEDIYVDINSFNGYKLHNGLELEKKFGIKLNVASKAQLKKLTWHADNYFMQRLFRRVLWKKKTECIEPFNGEFNDGVFLNFSDCYYEGYWQNYKYFHAFYNEICSTFSFPPVNQLSASNQEAIKQIEYCKGNSISLHVRRGDYVNNKGFGGICNLKYYERAIELARSECNNVPSFFVFSNDKEWCENNIKPMIDDFQYIFVDWNMGENSFLDMYLMSLCRINIIANSSFSWWAAYLNKNIQKIVIAPRQWQNGKNDGVKPQLPEWLLI